MTTPDSNAETWLGATGCAIGNHTWSGITPALVPKPTSARRKTRLRVAGGSGPDRQAADETPTSPPPRNRKAGGKAADPAGGAAGGQLGARTGPGGAVAARATGGGGR